MSTDEIGSSLRLTGQCHHGVDSRFQANAMTVNTTPCTECCNGWYDEGTPGCARTLKYPLWTEQLGWTSKRRTPSSMLPGVGMRHCLRVKLTDPQSHSWSSHWPAGAGRISTWLYN